MPDGWQFFSDALKSPTGMASSQANAPKQIIAASLSSPGQAGLRMIRADDANGADDADDAS
jgi:hypothetical protein